MKEVANGADNYYACTTGGSIWTITNTHPSKAGSIEIGITTRPGVSFSSGGIVYYGTNKFDIPVGGSVSVIWNLALDDQFSIRFGNFDGPDVLYLILTKNGNMVPDRNPYGRPNPPVSNIEFNYKIKGFFSLASTPAPTTIAPTMAPTAAPTMAPLTDPNFTQIVKGVRYYWPNSTISFKNISSKSNYIMQIKLECNALYKYGGYTACSVVGLPPPPGFNPDYSMTVRKSIAPGASVSFKMPSLDVAYIFTGIMATLADGTDYLLTADYPQTKDGYISFKEVPTGQDFIFQYKA
jgi:hypothetical protein